jgi:NTP pyrophosphatase (non-canonical NTP hydrolase)
MPNEQEIMETILNKLRDEIHENAVSHGWWEEDRSFAEVIALCHSELSEALEEYRNGHKPNEVYYSCSRKNSTCNTYKMYASLCEGCKDRKLEGIGVELADTIIRILDYCGKENIDIWELVKLKHEFNKGRSFKHGGKKI